MPKKQIRSRQNLSGVGAGGTCIHILSKVIEGAGEQKIVYFPGGGVNPKPEKMLPTTCMLSAGCTHVGMGTMGKEYASA